MISFYPGPSRLYDQVYQYMSDAQSKGVFSLNHRSREFSAIVYRAVKGLRKKLEIPEDYGIYFVSSATECWEIIAESFTVDGSSHFYNGSFGERWYQNTEKLTESAQSIPFEIDEPADLRSDAAYGDLICFTQNETSNGTALSVELLKKAKEIHCDALIAYDVTSSLGGKKFNFRLGDIWFASVQKCFGLPPGMAVMICSERAIQYGLKLDHNKHYNSFVNLHRNMEKYQTTHTPNTLIVYLLSMLMSDVSPISEIDQKTNDRSEMWYEFISSFKNLKLLVPDETLRSDTVIAVETDQDTLEHLKSDARENDILLGRGYGDWLNKSFRIANFPAISDDEIEVLKGFLKKTVS